MYVGYHYTKTNTNNVNKTKKLEVKTNIVSMPLRTSQLGTTNVKKHQRTTQKTNNMSNTDLAKTLLKIWINKTTGKNYRFIKKQKVEKINRPVNGNVSSLCIVYIMKPLFTKSLYAKYIYVLVFF